MRNILKKTALATAIATAFAGSAFAATDFTFAGGSTVKGTIVLASEIFGDEEGSGANETLIVMPNVEFDLSTAGGTGILTGAGDNVAATTGKATVKFTLGSGAVFGEDLTSTAFVNAANGGNGAFKCTSGAVGAAVADAAVDANCGAGGNITWQVTQGGAIGDNTITFQLDNTTGTEATIGGVQFGNVSVKNLIPSLGDKGNANFKGSLEFGIEYTEGADTTADTVNTTATDTPLKIFGSQPGVNLKSSTQVNFGTANFIRINVGSGEKTFTGGTVDGRSDFNPTGDTSWVKLGTLHFKRSSIDASFTTAAAGIVKKENGNDFDFQGGDKHELTLTAGAGTFQTGGKLYLANPGQCATGGTGTVADLTGEVATVSAANTSVKFTLAGTTTELTKTHDLCYGVKTGASATNVPEVSKISAKWEVKFFNTRYDNTDAAYSAYGPLTRNGCIASFFNVPASNNATDTAFIRLTNTSTTNTGDIRGTLWAQDGSVIGGAANADKNIAGALAPHATQVFSTKAADIVITGGKDILSLEKAFAVTPANFGPGGSRGRLVLKGAFDTCEGMGLIRTGDNGSLFNMTSTTMGNEAGGANDGNNAQ